MGGGNPESEVLGKSSRHIAQTSRDAIKERRKRGLVNIYGV